MQKREMANIKSNQNDNLGDFAKKHDLDSLKMMIEDLMKPALNSKENAHSEDKKEKKDKNKHKRQRKAAEDKSIIEGA